MTDLQLSTLLFHIARQINMEASEIRPHLREQPDQTIDPLLSLHSLAEVLFTQAQHLRGGIWQSPNR